jgi:ribosomal protein L1
MKTKRFGNFRIDRFGNIEFYIGWCGLEYEDIQNLKKALKYLKSNQKAKK